jgi:hypothetical protein
MKKLMLKHFKALLLSLSSMEMQEQKDRLASFYNEWKRENIQIGDVLIIGKRI